MPSWDNLRPDDPPHRGASRWAAVKLVSYGRHRCVQVQRGCHTAMPSVAEPTSVSLVGTNSRPLTLSIRDQGQNLADGEGHLSQRQHLLEDFERTAKTQQDRRSQTLSETKL